jgi:hypothetical protein
MSDQTGISSLLREHYENLAIAYGMKTERMSFGQSEVGALVHFSHKFREDDIELVIRISPINGFQEPTVQSHHASDILYIRITNPIKPNQSIQDYIRANFVYQHINYLGNDK